MNPKGETERTLNAVLRERDKSELKQEVAVMTPLALPAIKKIAAMMGMSIAAGMAHYNSQPKDEQKRLRTLANKKEQNKNTVDSDNDFDKDKCDYIYEDDTNKCNQTTKSKGKAAGRICHESAASRLSQCSRRLDKTQWTRLKN